MVSLLVIGAIVAGNLANWMAQSKIQAEARDKIVIEEKKRADEQTQLVQKERSTTDRLMSALLDLVKDKDDASSKAIITTMLQLGTATTGAVEELIKMLDVPGTVVSEADEARVEKYAQLMAKFGPSVVPSLRKGLANTNITRWGCVKALGLIGPPARETVPDLENLLKQESNELIRRDIQAAIQKIQKKS